MKKLFSISLILILSACAKERTTTHFSTQGINPDGSDTSILTNADYEKQQEEKRKQKLNRKRDPSVKPLRNPENTVKMDMDFEQEDIAKLYEAMDADVVSVGPPNGVYEYIGQERLQKRITLLTCTKQRPLPDQLNFPTKTHYYCSLEVNANGEPSARLVRESKLLYEYLNLPEVEDTHGLIENRTFQKAAGRFFCEKAVNIETGDVKYGCSIHQIYAAVAAPVDTH